MPITPALSASRDCLGCEDVRCHVGVPICRGPDRGVDLLGKELGDVNGIEDGGRAAARHDLDL